MGEVKITSVERLPINNDGVVTFSNGAQQLCRILFEEDGMWVILSALNK